jgi:hypothetical protein
VVQDRVRLQHVREADVPEIVKIWEAHHSRSFTLPRRDSRITEAKVIDEGGRIIAYGQVKPIAEAIFVADLARSQRDRIAALKLLMSEAFRGTEQAHLDRLYAFTRDPGLADLIVKHFAFERSDPGEFLIRSL